MNSRERVRAAISHKPIDRVPAAFEAVPSVYSKLLKHYGYSDFSQLIDRFEIDIVSASPTYCGPKLKEYRNEKGQLVRQSFWGFEETFHQTDVDVYTMTSYYPLNGAESISDIQKFTFPDPDWFDYSSITETCEKYPDKAIIVGHEGPFQIVTFLMEMDQFFLLMMDEPEAAQYLLDRISDFELEYYRRIFEAGKGRVDILRPHDDYGTQISLLFSVDTWKTFYKENTRKLVELAHKYGVFYQQHSCGAVRPLIPEFIDCGVDVLEPLQKVTGLDPEGLRDDFDGKITFHGGIDTQHLLPYGTADAVKKETEHIIQTLGRNGGYILMASQAFEGDVPIENIEAVYSVPRSFTP